MIACRIPNLALAAVLVAVLEGCATAPAPDRHALGTGNAVVAAAADVVGTPYRYGGSSPHGFDCSGLVHYAHQQAGITVPRTTEALLSSARPVDLHEVRAGDVLFFQVEGKKVSHVGIYAGDDRFIHAPSSGKAVSWASWRSPYWRPRLVGVGRFDGATP